MTTEEYYKANKYTEFDKHDKRIAKFDYYDLIDFAHRYHENELKLLNIPVVVVSETELCDYCSDGEAKTFLCDCCFEKVKENGA